MPIWCQMTATDGRFILRFKDRPRLLITGQRLGVLALPAQHIRQLPLANRHLPEIFPFFIPFDRFLIRFRRFIEPAQSREAVGLFGQGN